MIIFVIGITRILTGINTKDNGKRETCCNRNIFEENCEHAKKRGESDGYYK